MTASGTLQPIQDDAGDGNGFVANLPRLGGHVTGVHDGSPSRQSFFMEDRAKARARERGMAAKETRSPPEAPHYDPKTQQLVGGPTPMNVAIKQMRKKSNK